MHGLIFETSVCYWQNQPGCYLFNTKIESISPIRSEDLKGRMFSHSVFERNKRNTKVSTK